LSAPVAFPGPAGSHTAAAAAALFPSAQLVPLGGFRAVAEAVTHAEAAHGVLPIESSLVGAVAETHDILSDVAAEVTGGLGLAGSASLGESGPGLFEPVHGSAPDIAGRGIANPTAMLRSTALLLEHGLGLPDEARALSRAIEAGLVSTPTADLGGSATTADLGTAIRGQLAVDGFAPGAYRAGDGARA
jgi:hypothetical protein